MKHLAIILSILLTTQYLMAQSLPTAGLVLHYDAQDIDGDGDFTDQPSNGSAVSAWINQSSAGNALTSSGNEPTFNANGINVNGAINFDGTNDLFTIANSTDLNEENQTDEISLAIVLETGSSVAGDQIIYEQGGGARGYSFAIQNNRIYAGIWNNIEWDVNHQYKSVDLGVVSPNTIYFITIVQNSSSGTDATNTLSIYLNGALASSVNHVDPQRRHPNAIGLGRINSETVLPANNIVGNTTNTNYFQGMIGEFAIWKNALSQTEINDLNAYFINRWSLKTPPNVDLNGLASNGQNFQTQYSQGSIPINIANSGAADISDIESVYLSNLQFKINDILDGTNEVLNINGTDIVLSNNNVTIIPANNGLPKLRSIISSGTGSDAGKQLLLLEALNSGNSLINLAITDAKSILRNITYENQATPVSLGVRTIEITATDNDNKTSAPAMSEIEIIVGAPAVDLNGSSVSGGNYSTSYTNLSTENITAPAATITSVNNIASLELFLAVQDVNLENFNISGTAINVSSNGVTNINASTNLTVTVSEITTGLNSGKQRVLIVPATSLSANDMQTLLQSITYQHSAGTFSASDRIIGVIATNINGISSSQVNTTLNIESPPINNVPGSRTTEANTPLSIPDISCSDEDGDLNSLRIVAMSGGDLDITPSGSVVLSGNNIDILILTGNELDINISLASLVYTSTITTGSEILEVTSTDLLGAQDIDQITIAISPPPLSGLVLHYDAQDIDGDGDFTDQPADGSPITTWIDQSSSAPNNAATSGGNQPTFNANGINANGAINFDGNNDLFTIANSTELNEETQTNEISLAIVLETGSSVAGDQIIYEQGGGLRGYSFVIQNNHIYAGIWNNTEWDAAHQYKSVDLGVVQPNTIYYITIVQNSSSGVDATNTLSIYLNGSLASSVNHVDPQRAHGGSIGLGRINGGTVLPANNVVGNTGNTDYFNGMIGEFMIWKNALSQTEINTLNTYFTDRWSLKNPPVLDLNGLASNGQNFQTQFSEGSIPVNIANASAASISDLENNDLLTMEMKINNLLDGAAELLNINGTNIVLSSNTTIIIPANNGLPKLQSTISAGTGSDAGKQLLRLEALDNGNAVTTLSIGDAQTILRTITYENQLAPLSQGLRTIEITATDTDNKTSATVLSEINVIAGAPIVDLNGSSSAGGNYTTNYANLTTENITATNATISAGSNISSLELFLAVQDLNLENFNISGTAIDISANGVTNINASTNLTVTVSEITTGLNAGNQSVLIEPATAISASAMQTLLLSITFEHLAGTFSSNDRVIGVVVTDINGFSSSQVNSTLETITDYEWTGATNNNWNEASNWNNSIVPPNDANIVIPNTANIPSLDQSRSINTLTMNNSSINLSGFTLTINGDITVNSCSISGGELLFLGTGAKQFISATGIFTVENITINNSAGVDLLSGEINLSNTLTLSSGDFFTNNALTLISDISGTARIAEITGGSIVGEIDVQRYIAAGATNWRFLSSAINGSNLAEFNDDFQTSGYTGALYPNWPTASNPWVSIYYYDETEPGTQDDGFLAATNSSNAIAQGDGLWVWSGDAASGTAAFTIDMKGTPNVGNINLPITYTNYGSPADDGWNMVGNPYPSAIDWNSSNISKSNVNNAIYIWNPQNEQFASYVGGIGTNGGSNVIASNQAFWIQANAANPSVQVSEASKTDLAPTFLKQSTIAPLRIITQNAFGSDELIINLEENASINFDPLYDAEKIASSNTSLPSSSSSLSGMDYSINQLNPQEISIPIKILVGYTGIHSIKIKNALNFNPSSCLILEDLFTGNSYDLATVDSFSTTIYDTTLTARFLLHIGAPVEITTKNMSCFGNNDAKIVYSKNSNNPFDITWKNSLNSIISSNSNAISQDSITNLSPDNYYIETNDVRCGNTIDTITILAPGEILSDFISDNDTTSIALGGTINFTNQSSNATSYFWDFGDFNTSTAPSPSHQYTQSGTYTVTLNAAQSDSCYSLSTKTIFVIDDITTAITSTSNTNEHKIWISNNELFVEGASFQLVKVSNVLGQTIFESKNQKIFNLNQLKSQTLIVTIYSKDTYAVTKISYTKQ